MEVLPVVLAEGAAAVQRNELDASVAGTRAGVDDAADHEAVLTLLAVHDGAGGRDPHHRVRVHVEDEPSGRAEAKGQGGERRAEIGRSEVVKAIKRTDRSVVYPFDVQYGKRRSNERTEIGRA